MEISFQSITYRTLFLPNVIRVIRIIRLTKGGGHLAKMTYRRNDFKFSTSKHMSKKRLPIPKSTFEDNIKVDLK